MVNLKNFLSNSWYVFELIHGLFVCGFLLMIFFLSFIFLLKKHHVSLFVGPQMFLNIGMWLHQWGGQFNDYNTPNISYLGASPCIYLNAMCPPWICSSLGISLLEEIQKIGWPPLIGETDMYFIIWWVHLHFIVGRVTPYNPYWLVQEGRERQAQ